MTSDWKKYRIGDVCSITSSKRIFANEYVDSGIPFYRGKEIIEKFNGKQISTELYITLDKFLDIKNKYGVPQKGDILLTSVGTLGIPYRVKDEQFYFKDGNLTWFQNFKNVDSKFLYLWFCSKYAKNQILAKCIGSTQKALTIETLKQFEINLPSLETQQKIAKVLSAIDDKIELNNSINKNLEQQAQAIFKSWFIDFEPFDGSIPDDWIEGALGDFIEIKRGGSPRPIQDYISDTGYRWLKISDATAIQSPFILNIKEHIKASGLNKTVLLKAGSLVLSNSATPGIPKILDVDSCIHDGWLYFPNSKLSNEYLYLLFQFIRPNLVALGNGSVFTNLKTDILKNYETILPNENFLYKFNSVVGQMFQQILNNTRENERLTQLRDTLLPKLMNGEIDVDKVEV